MIILKSIFGILKKFTIPIIITICLLVLQAELDLSLPDYTANIINIGIQEKGIEYAYPNVVRKSILDEVLEISDDKEFIKEQYNLDNDKYYIKELKKEDKKLLEDKIVKDFMFIMMIDSNNEQIRNSLNINTDLNTFYSMLPVEQKIAMKNNMLEKVGNLDDTMLKQMAIESVKQEYQNNGFDLDKLQINYIISNGLKMICLALLLMACAISVGFLASRIATKFSYLLREKIVSKIMSFSSKEFNLFSLASLITRSTNDVQQIQMILVMFLRIIIFAPIIGFGALFKVLGNQMNWVLGLAVGLILLIVLFLFIFAMPKFKLIQKLVDKLNLVTRERLTGIPVIRAFGTVKVEEERFANVNNDLAKTLQFCDRVMGIMMPTMMFIMNGVSILIIWVGASQIDAGTVQIGTIMAFITYAIQVIMSFLMISMVSIMLPRSLISFRRVAEVLNKESSILENENPEEFKNNEGTVEFKNVSFSYPDADGEILSDISFKAKKGTTTAIIGSTGSGKSTLINLIPRFFDVTKGSILVDGSDIRNVDIHALRDKIGYVPQKGNLFFGTIKSNVLFGQDENNDKILKEACEVAQASDFISKLPNEYNYAVSQGGTNVSGGQRQRLSIARAIAKKPEIYIFDDSFSALDFKTDANLRKALREYTNEATILIVAQRISTVLNADQIVVLDSGKVVGIGTHEELFKNCDVYKEIALSQLKESELNA